MKALSSLLLLLTVTAVCAQPQAFLVVRANVPANLPSQVLPVLATANLTAVQAVFGATPHTGLIVGSETIGGRPRGVLGQLDVIGDQARFMLLLPSEPAGSRLVRLAGDPVASIPGPPALRVTRDGAKVTITNLTCEITHDPAKNGGLPSRIVFPQTGKVLAGFAFNDRLHRKDIGGFSLSEDKAPQVTVTAAGPLYAEVQVTARYLRRGEAPPSHPRATYTYSYFAGQPSFRIAGDVQQDDNFAWHEQHFFEFYFKDDSFTHFATEAEPLAAFADGSTDHRGHQWAALIEGQHALALLTPGLIHDGKGAYGRYLHGPWVRWSAQQASFAADVWIGTAEDPVSEITRAAGSKSRILTGVVYSPKLLEAVTQLQQRSRQRPRLGWMLSLLERALQQRALSLPEAEKAAAAMLADKPLPGNALRLGGQVAYVVNSQGLGLGLSREQDRIVSLYDLRHGRELLGAPALWFRLALRGADGVVKTLDSTDFLLRQPGAPGTMESWRSKRPNEPSKLRFFSKGTQFPGLTVTLQPTLLEDRLQWSLAVDNARAEWSLLSVTTPLVHASAMGDDAADDQILVPAGFGKSYPALAAPGYGDTYPSGWATMQWMAVTDATSGLYVGCHDPTAATKILRCSGASDSGVPFEFELTATDATVPGNDFAPAGEVVLAAVDGGYLPACRLYRQWLDRKAPWWPEPGKYSRSDYPQWVQDVQTWALWGAGDASKTVPPTKVFAEAMGVPTALHWYNWHAIPFDNDYPNYFPTRPGFREGVRELQQAGVRVMPYINGRLWDTDTASFKAEGYKAAARQEDGKPYIEVYSSKQELAPMCVHMPVWQDTAREVVRKLVSEEGVDGVYIDQVAAAPPVLCYDQSHGHPLAGGHWWVDGYWKMLAATRQQIRQVSPDKMLTTESNAEPYAKYFDAYLTCNSNTDYEVPLFPAVYSGKILLFGTYMADSDMQDMMRMAIRQGKLFAFGAQLWWCDPTVTQRPEATKWLRDLAHLRQRVNAFFVRGQMAPPPVFAEKIEMLVTDWNPYGTSPNKIQIHTPSVWATAWRLEEGKLMMALVNIPKQERTLTLQFDPTAYALQANAKVKLERLTVDGQTETCTRQGKFTLPVKLEPAEATALVITPQ